MTIRKLNVDDLNQLLELYVHLIPNDDPLPEKDAVCSIWSSICGNSDRLYFGVFEERMVSTCNLTIIPNLTRGCRPYGLIENVVTHADHRRKGYGKAVLDHALNYAKDRNCYKVMLLTGSKKEETYRFYESVGFDRHTKQGFVIRFPHSSQNA
jgi:GNAT superfamily N-acetyltransferase